MRRVPGRVLPVSRLLRRGRGTIIFFVLYVWCMFLVKVEKEEVGVLGAFNTLQVY